MIEIEAATVSLRRHGPLAALGLCIVLGGAAGLVYEVVWARMLGVFLGASAPAHAVVLAGFLGGLALGNAVFGRLVDRRAHLALGLYATLEGVVGVYGLLSPEIFGALSRLYERSTADISLEASPFAAKLLLALAFVVPPTVAMGGTLPALARALVLKAGDMGSDVSRLYLANTAGAAAGAFAGGLILLPRLGAVATARWMGVANLVVALVIGLLALRNQRQVHLDAAVGVAASDYGAPRDHAGSIPLLMVAFIIGWASLTMEVTWTRVFAMVYGSSAQAFTLMLTVFVAGIALGTLLVAPLLRRCTRPGDEVRLLAVILAVAAALLVVQLPLYEHLPFWQFEIAQLLERRPHVYPVYLACQSALAFGWMLPLTVATGAALPLLVHCYTDRVESIGGGVGAIFASNTVGNVIGPLVATFALLPLIGLRGTVGAAVIALTLAAMICARISRWRSRFIQVVLGASVLGAVALPGWDASVMHAGGFRRWTLAAGSSYGEFRDVRDRVRVLFSYDGAADSVVVIENRDGLRFMKVNGKTDASDAEDLPTQRMVAHLPLLLHRAFSGRAGAEVFVVGVGSGVTVGSASMHEGVEVVAAEISKGVLAASRFFEHVNRGYDARPNVAVYQGDARELLARSDGDWDVIINQPSNPWIAGNAALFSREFFEMARAKLAPGGIMAQWMHVYAMDDTSVEIVMSTFASVFPHVSLWWPQGVDLILIGTNEPLELDLAELRLGLSQRWLLEEMAGYDREGLRVTTVARLLALQVQSDAGFRAAFPGGRPHTTDLWPTLEFRAPLAQFVGARSERFVELDERLQPVPARGLHLFDDLRVFDVADLLVYFAERETPFSARITGSLAYAVYSGVPVAADFEGLITRATGLPIVLESWTEEMLADTPDAVTCRAYADIVAATYPLRATRFHRPDPNGPREVLAECAGLHPELSVYLRGKWAETLVGCGWADEARAEIDSLLELSLPLGVIEALGELRERL